MTSATEVGVYIACVGVAFVLAGTLCLICTQKQDHTNVGPPLNKIPPSLRRSPAVTITLVESTL